MFQAAAPPPIVSPTSPPAGVIGPWVAPLRLPAKCDRLIIKKADYRGVSFRDAMEELLSVCDLQLAFVEDDKIKPLTLRVRESSVASIIRAILDMAGLKASLVGRTLFVGTKPLAAISLDRGILTFHLRQALPSVVASALKGVDGDTNFLPDDKTSTLFISAPQSSADLYLSLIAELDRKPKQVSVEVAIASIDTTADSSLGGGFSLGAISSSAGNIGLNFSNGIPILGSSNFGFNIAASLARGTAKLLANPTLTLGESQTGTVNLTQEVFAGYNTSYQQTGSTTVPLQTPIIKSAGLSLSIGVEKLNDDYVQLNLEPTISSISGSASTSQGTISLLASRSVKSGSIRLKNNQTLIVSGVIQDSDRRSVTKVPILGDIPLLGILFRSSTTNKSRDEIVVSVRPHILQD
jgi:type II secretory pathway component GspD/PulD (secretin)